MVSLGISIVRYSIDYHISKSRSFDDAKMRCDIHISFHAGAFRDEECLLAVKTLQWVFVGTVVSFKHVDHCGGGLCWR